MAHIPAVVLELIETFDRHIDTYRSRQYNEAQLRKEFIDPFFEALGWDVTNKAGFAHAYKDVIHEDAIKIAGGTKAPDYCFRIGGTRKFFLEAKKPAVDIKGDPHPAYQLRRYAWSAKLPLSILTDFEEFAVYDCQIKPKQTDGPSVARIIYLTYKEYLHNWPRISEIFGKDAIQKGSFDKFALSTKAKRGTTTVDTEFLAEIEKWRDMLAKIIALRNRNLSIREINFVVQRTIDRIIFLRMCEDRGIEPYSQLQSIVTGDRTYPRLCEIFEKADQKYNSGLFHFEDEPGRPEPPDRLTPNITIDDNTLKWLLHNLYYPLCPYEFSVLPAEILGNVYEQFLGSVIQVSPARRTKIVPKPEVKKAGGVYYTPSYIVDYIVKNTVAKLIEGKTPKQIQNLKILDPACGSGSFLLGAYTCLLDYHRDWYTNNQPENWTKKKNPPIYQVSSPPSPTGDDSQPPNYQLTITEKKRILLNNIFGVDIDSQAVEVTKLSLLLKVLEGENSQTLENQYRLFHERALPDLAENIKCGNSLIAPDFFDSSDPSCHSRETCPQGSRNPDDLYEKINPFDWKQEFPQIFSRKNPGFDTVIGNPPWGGDIDDITRYIQMRYPQSTQGYRDTSKLFIDKAVEITGQGGLFSFIVPSALMFQPRYIDIRRILKQYSLVILWNVGDRVFGTKVAAPCCIIVLHKKPPTKDTHVSTLDTAHLKDNVQRVLISQSPLYRQIPQSVYDRTTQETFVTFHRELGTNEIALEHILDCRDCGIKHQRVGVGLEKKGKSDLAARLYYEGPRQSIHDHRYLTGSDLSINGWYIDYSSERYFRENYEKLLRKNEIVYFKQQIFDLQQKIVWRQTSDRIRATIIGPHWFGNTLQAGILRNADYDLRYLLGLLNSKFLNFIYIESVKESGRVFPQVKMSKVRALPIRTIDFDNPADKAMHDRMVKLVERMLDLHKKLAAAKIPDEKTKIQRQITATDNQIDRLVYELYDLTKEEIAIVEHKKQ